MAEGGEERGLALREGETATEPAEAVELEAQYEDALAELDFGDRTIAFIRHEFDGGGAWRLENPETSVPGSVMADAGATLWEPPPTSAS